MNRLSAGGLAPIHRLESPTQTPEDAARQEYSGEIWGRAAWQSSIPKVKAYLGPLPDGVRGIEFYAATRPNIGTRPHTPEWYAPNDGIWVDDEFAKMRCRVVRNTQS